MRQITEKIVSAFERRVALKVNNTRTDGTSIWLHNNKIAEWYNDGLWISNAGWDSRTTKERLNGLTGVRIHSHRGTLYLNGNAWDGGWVNVGMFSNYWGSTEAARVVEEVEAEVVFDITSEWMSAGYSKPVYAIYHTNAQTDLDAIELKLHSLAIPSRRMESDTTGIYKPNYFVVVRPEDFNNSLIIIK